MSRKRFRQAAAGDVQKRVVRLCPFRGYCVAHVPHAGCTLFLESLSAWQEAPLHVRVE